jgi:acetylornithine deacetylase/succinyl-diaminopimelate desuccinylase-like protein
MIIAAKALKAELENRGTISIASVVDEEAESEFGMKYLSENRFIHADAAIFGEPAFPSIVTALKGGVWLKLITLGKKVGSGWPSEGVNAVMKMTKVLNELQKLDIAEGFLENPLLGKPTMALGTTVRGGDSLHTLPDRCEATVEIYTVPGQSTKVVISKIKSLLEKMQKLDKDLSVRLEILFEVSPIITKTTERIYRDLQSSIFAIFGKEAEPIGIPSIGDARFTQDLGIPTIIAYGPGEKGKGHVANESVEIENVKRVAKVYALTAMRFWKS